MQEQEQENRVVIENDGIRVTRKQFSHEQRGANQEGKDDIEPE
jgi:hypothetical protein